MISALMSLTALQGHVTRAIKILSDTLTQDQTTEYAVIKLEKQLDKYIAQQIAVAELCADEQQVAVLDMRIEGTINAANAILMNANSSRNNNTSNVGNRGPRRVIFRPLDHDNVRLWIRQVEDVFATMGIDKQLDRFTTLTTLLNESEATVIQDITMAEPRPPQVFDEAKQLLYARYDRPVHERLTRAMSMRGFDVDESPSQWLARFRQTRGNCSIDDLDRWALIRQMPSALHPTLDALRPTPTLDEFVKQADRLIKTVQKSSTPVNTLTPDSNNAADDTDVNALIVNRKQSKSKIRPNSYSGPKREPTKQKFVCWFHERYKNKARSCEGEWCIGYKDSIPIYQSKRSGNDRGEQL